MMSIKQLFQSGLGLALVALVSVQAVAFMNAVEPVDTVDQEYDYVSVIDSIAADMKGETYNCDAMLARIDQALLRIDELLDAGATDEESLLVARETLVAMRLKLACVPEELAVMQSAGGGNVISDVVIGESIISNGVPGVGCVNCAPVSTGGAVASGGGGAAGAAGGPGLRRLLLLGGLTGGIIAAATSGDDDNPPPATSM